MTNRLSKVLMLVLVVILIAATPAQARSRRIWRDDLWWGMQEADDCSAYAWAAWLTANPARDAPPIEPEELHRLSQEGREWTVGAPPFAGAEVLQGLGYISSWRLATSWHETRAWLLERGPIPIGITWYMGLERHRGPTRVHEGAINQGSHSLLMDGIDLEHRWVRLKNSWGQDWNDDGYVKVRLSSIRWILFGNDGSPSAEIILAEKV